MLLKRGVFRGLLAAGALFGATSGIVPPIEPPAPETGLSSRASAWIPGATQSHEETERAMIERQNQVILALVMSAVNSRILE
jgi:hypothetical protein